MFFKRSAFGTCAANCVKYQFCAPGGQSCSVLNPIYETALAFNETGPALNDVQLSTADTIYEALSTFNTFMSLMTQGGEGGQQLIASRSLITQRQSVLPPNQWQIEVQGWFSNVLAVIQKRLTLSVVGPGDALAQKYVVNPKDSAGQAVCGSFRIRIDAGFNNLSLLGMLILLIVGTLIVSASLILEPVVVRLGRTRAAGDSMAEHYRSWIHDGVLQIQRVAYEFQEHHEWENIDGVVPLTVGRGISVGLLKRGTFYRENEEKPDSNMEANNKENPESERAGDSDKALVVTMEEVPRETRP
jgi:hypothetical protein